MIETSTLKELNITDVADRLGLEILKYGKARCYNTASHSNGDKNPSLKLYERTQTYYCFTCREAGDTIKLVQKVLGYDFKEACDWLERSYGVNATTGEPIPKIKRAKVYRPEIVYNDPTDSDKAIYRYIYDQAELNKPLLTYLRDKKGFSDTTVKKFHWRQLSDKAIAKVKDRYTIDELKEAGLITSNGKLIYEINRTLIPYFDMSELVYLRARDITGKGKIRFINPVGKSIPLYNINALDELGYETNTLYIAEGETDTMALSDDGYLAVGIAGGANNPTIYKLVDTLSEGFSNAIKTIVVSDNDPTGDKFTEIITKLLYARGFTTQLMRVPDEYKDYGDYKIDKKRGANNAEKS
jgi:DNA primase